MNLHRSPLPNHLFALVTFGVAMGFLEAVVVVYLRQIFYPTGFAFPLRPMSSSILSIESLREIATIVMLMAVSILGGSGFLEAFSFFLIIFGVWDIFYYAWLKVLVHWPSTLLDWDVLFLIPVIWIGPVLAPLICSGTMMALGIYFLVLLNRGHAVRIGRSEWLLMGMGISLIFITFVWDVAHMIIKGGFYSRFWTLGANPDFQRCIAAFVPSSFNWPLFITGEVLIFSAMVSLGRRINK
ncbi:MAG: hypothetical protein ACLPX5_07420 [Dissulfurispiraceae bacterium]